MANELIFLNTEEKTALLKEALINQGLVEEKVIKDLLDERDKAVELGKKQMQGICYAIDYKEKKLKIFDTYTEEVLNSIPLPVSISNFVPEEWLLWGTSTAIIDLLELQKAGDIPFNRESLFGLTIKDNYHYLYSTDFNKQPLLAKTNNFLFGATPKNKKTNLPFDMYFSEDNEILCLSNRDEGKVHIYNTKVGSFIGSITVRNPGSKKGINVAISFLRNKIYITDNLSENIIIYDLFSGLYDKFNPGLGILNNIALSPNETSIYVILPKKEPLLKNLDINTFEEIRSFPLKGELFSSGDSPFDLISCSPDKKYLFVMTYLNTPSPYTPMFTIIDLKINRGVKRFSLKDDSRPINIAFRGENPIGQANKSFEKLLVEKELIDVAKLIELKKSLGQDSPEDLEGLIEIQTEALESELREEDEMLGITPKKAKHIILSPKANKHIMEVLSGCFWQATQIDLSETSEGIEKLKTVADNVRQRLEYYDADIVRMLNFHEEKPLNALIQRAYVLEMWAEEENKKRQDIQTAPDNCLNCNAPLFGGWECPACGFTLEKPEDALRRKSASLDHLANMKGNFFVIDSENGILLEIDKYYVPVFKLSKDILDLKSIVSAFKLENRNALLLDKKAGNIVEVTFKGETQWKYKPADPKKGILSEPSGFAILSNENLLIADTGNHRVLEVDREGKIIWEYGTLGKSGINSGFLNSPVDIQKTYDDTYLVTDMGNNRVIEFFKSFNEEKKIFEFNIKWQYGNGINITGHGQGSGNNELNRPVSAFKDTEGKYLILDSGNHRAILVNEMKNTLWKYEFKNPDSPINIGNPMRITRLKNQDLIIVGNNKVLQIMPSNYNNMPWFSQIDELASITHFSIARESIEKEKRRHALSKKYLAKDNEEEEDSESPEIYENKELNALIAEKLLLAGKMEPGKIHIILTKGEKIIPFPIALIDKGENCILIVNREGDIVWIYGKNKDEKLIKPNSVEITENKTVLISDQNEVIEVDIKTNDKTLVYECLSKSATRLGNGNTLITDQKNSKVIEVTPDKKIIWEYHEKDRKLSAYHAMRLDNGNTLITSCVGHYVKEIDKNNKILWSFGEPTKSGSDSKHLSYPEHACRLKNGNTLISDTKNSRILEISNSGKVVLNYSGSESQKILGPCYTSRLKDNHIFIIHSSYRQIQEVNDQETIVWRLIMSMKKQGSK